MRGKIVVVVSLLLVSTFPSLLANGDDPGRPLLIVTTDIGQDPDDLQSMIRLLHYADQFELLALVANADINRHEEAAIVQDTLIHICLDAYAKIEENLRLHSPDFPSSNYLRSIVKKGCNSNGENVPIEQYIGEDRDTEGSDRIIRAVARATRPVAVAVWGGGCDLAQALWRVSQEFDEKNVAIFIEKLRVYFIGRQDSSVEWILRNYPSLWAILSDHPGGDKWESTYRGMFAGGDMSNTTKDWIERFLSGINPLASLYPRSTFTGGEQHNPHMAVKEGDSPSFLYFLENGLNDPEHPHFGGWGGRYEEIKPFLYSDAQDYMYDPQQDSIVPSAKATIFRWRRDIQNEFAARAQWGILSYNEANHPPEIKIASHVFDKIERIECQAGNSLLIDATPSSDPDGDELAFEWFFYQEASSYPFCDKLITAVDPVGKIEVQLPQAARGKTIHLILRVEDDAGLPLAAYRRIILEVI